MQLSDPDDYEGGNVQFIDESGHSYFAPRKRGTIILFDSRTQHRVLPVKKESVNPLLVGLLVPVGSEVNMDQIEYQERCNTGSAWTRNEQFEKDGYLVYKNLWDPEELFYPVPEVRGKMIWWGKKRCINLTTNQMRCK